MRRPFQLSPRLASLFQVGLLQGVVQVLAFLSGILIVRLLPESEYALYTLANTLLGTMTMIGDGGIASGLMAHGAKAWPDRVKVSAVASTAFALRTKLCFWTIVITGPILISLLHKHGASPLLSALLTLSIIPSFLATTKSKLFEVAPRLAQDLGEVQRTHSQANALRFVLNLLFLLVFPFAGVALLAAGASQIFTAQRLKSVFHKFADDNQPIDPGIHNKLAVLVKRSLPTAIYLSLLGQLTVVLVSIFGSTEAVAEVGALGRLAMVLTFFQVLFDLLVAPRFAKLKDDKSLLLKRFLGIQAVLWLAGFALYGLVALFPNQTLWILGSNYGDLQTEVLLLAAISGITLIQRGLVSLNYARGYILNPWFFIPWNIGIQTIAYAISLPVDAKSALTAQLIGTSLSPVVQTFNFLSHWRSLKPS